MVMAVVVSAGALLAARPERAAAAVNRGSVRIISVRELRAAMKQHRGRVLVLHLWATWCEPCLRELPLVGALAREAPADGVDVLSVSLDDSTARAAEEVARVLEERGSTAMSRNIVRMDDPDALVASIDPRWRGDIPAFFAYDRRGRLRHAQVGEMTRDGFHDLVKDLLTAPVVKK
jgi:thiol-disulfide isomerase/thioredoxin